MSTRAREIAELGQKLTVDASGNLDIAGNITSDGFILGNNDTLIFQDSNGTNRNILQFTTGNSIVIGGAGAGVNDITLKNNGAKDRLKVGANGDIKFYNSDGSVAKFHWDATDQRLGLGTETPDNTFHVVAGADGEVAQFTGSVENRGLSIRVESNSGDASANTILNAQSGGNAGAFSFRTDNTERVVITKTGNVGIGASSPSLNTAYDRVLHIHSGLGSLIKLTDDSSGSAVNDGFDILQYAAGSYLINRETNGFMVFTTANQEAMRITGSGALIIGGTTANTGSATTFHQDGTWRNVLASGTGGDSFMSAISGVSNGYQISVDSSNNQTYKWHNASSQSMTLDSSGILLVGMTSTSSTSNGVRAIPSGTLTATRDGEKPLVLNRKTSDGDIAEFRKDGSQIGVIGVDNTDNLTVAGNANHAGLMFGTDGVLPYKAGALRNGTEDLGSAAHRWRDVVVSGGIFLGGTTNSNKLDDYEEGTWTPAFTFSTTAGSRTYSAQDGEYTKIGNMVYVTGVIITTAVSGGSGSFSITGLPFNVRNSLTSTNNESSMTIRYFNGTAVDGKYVGYFHDGTSTVISFSNKSDISSALGAASFGNSTSLRFDGWYRTDS
jgi:hypothetical protein